MKFVVVVVLFALALGANSSVISWPAPFSYTAVHGPTLALAAAHPPAAVAVHASPLQLVAAPSSVILAGHVPSPLVVEAHAPVVVAAPVEGTYVAKTRGAVHVAPLPGHANSASSVNLQPAPGTI